MSLIKTKQTRTTTNSGGLCVFAPSLKIETREDENKQKLIVCKTNKVEICEFNTSYIKSTPRLNSDRIVVCAFMLPLDDDVVPIPYFYVHLPFDWSEHKEVIRVKQVFILIIITFFKKKNKKNL